MFLFWDIFIDLSSQLEEERNEVQRLEAEKKEWLSRGVHAEFEKKDKVQLYMCTSLYSLIDKLTLGQDDCIGVVFARKTQPR